MTTIQEALPGVGGVNEAVGFKHQKSCSPALLKISPEEEQRTRIDSIVYSSDTSSIRRHTIRHPAASATDGDWERPAGDAETMMTVAIKCLNGGPNQSSKDVACLHNEYNILTRQLLGCSCVRAAIKKEKVEGGSLAIYLEWVEGMTLKEFMEVHPLKDDILTKIRVAYKVASGIAEIHDRGVMHNDISPENIIVNVDESRCEAKIIDFGDASPSILSEADDVGERANDDLYQLGSVFYGMFIGDETLHDDLQSRNRCGSIRFSRESRGSIVMTDALGVPTMVDIEHEKGNLYPIPESTSSAAPLPRSVSTLISNLMETGGFISGPNPYKSARELKDDLEQMVTHPKIFLFDPTKGKERKLCRTHRLYGREKEVEQLTKALDSIASAPLLSNGQNEGTSRSNSSRTSYASSVGTEETDDNDKDGNGIIRMVLIAGHAGTGKTALVKKMRSPVKERGGCLIRGKYDQLQRVAPYSALIAAFTELCQHILSKDADTIQAMAYRIRKAVGSLGKVIADVVPAIESIIGEQSGDGVNKNVRGMEAANRLKFVFRSFVKAISSPSQPILLFIDDLQWADQASLDLIKALVTDRGNKGLLFVGCYRNNEVRQGHPFMTTIREIYKKGVPLSTIEIGNLNEDAVNLLISESLRLPRRLTRSLTDIVYRFTQGNAFFTVQLLESLYSNGDGPLRYSPDSARFEWDESEIKARNLSDGVLQLMSDKLLSLPVAIQDVIKLAASLGARFDEATLLSVITHFTATDGNRLNSLKAVYSTDLRPALTTLVDRGLIERTALQSTYAFSHDKIEEAAYSLLPEEERGLIHLKIGKMICEAAEDGDREGKLFAGVDQLNRGIVYVQTESEKTELARLNLNCGRMAFAASAFSPASSYLYTGIRLLGHEGWAEHYDICLSLHTALAETLVCLGHFFQTAQVANEVFKHAKSKQDTFLPHCSLIKSFAAQGKFVDAIDTGFIVLAQLGELFPRKPSKQVIISDLIKTKLLLKMKARHDLSRLPVMANEEKCAAMQLLSFLFAVFYISRPDFAPLIAFRMVQLSLKFGVSSESAYGFMAYGVMMCGLGDLKGGHRFGKLSLSLLERFDSKEWYAHVVAPCHAAIMHWHENIQDTLDPFLRSYQVGMEAGDIEYGCYSLYHYCHHAFECGRPLQTLEREMAAYCKEMTEHAQDTPYKLTLPIWQCVRNLMGCSIDPLQLTGQVMNQDDILEEVQKTGNNIAVRTIYVDRLMLGYMFGNYELAAEMAEKSRDVAKISPGLILVLTHAFYDGLTSFALARDTKANKWTARGCKAIKKMKKWAKHCPSNALHKLHLLEAEKAVLKGKTDAASKAYDAAISGSNQSGFLQDEALAYERAALFHRQYGDNVKACRYLARSHHLYTQWGALAKAEQMNSLFSIISMPEKKRNSFQLFSKERSAQVSPHPTTLAIQQA